MNIPSRNIDRLLEWQDGSKNDYLFKPALYYKVSLSPKVRYAFKGKVRNLAHITTGFDHLMLNNNRCIARYKQNHNSSGSRTKVAFDGRVTFQNNNSMWYNSGW